MITTPSAAKVDTGENFQIESEPISRKGRPLYWTTAAKLSESGGRDVPFLGGGNMTLKKTLHGSRQIRLLGAWQGQGDSGPLQRLCTYMIF